MTDTPSETEIEQADRQLERIARQSPDRPVFRYKPQPIAQAGLPIETGRLTVPAAQQTALPDDIHDIIELMVHGLDEGGTIGEERIEAGYPLTLMQSCEAIGMKRKRAREWAATPLFIASLNKALRSRQQSERARNLATAVEIRDNKGDKSAARDTVRLKAIATIEGNEGKSSVNVNINSHNSQTNIVPGYVVRLGNRQPSADQQAIEGTAIEIEAVTDDSQDQSDT